MSSDLESLVKTDPDGVEKALCQLAREELDSSDLGECGLRWLEIARQVSQVSPSIGHKLLLLVMDRPGIGRAVSARIERQKPPRELRGCLLTFLRSKSHQK